MQQQEQNFNPEYRRIKRQQPLEKNNGISKTVPDQTMSIREIMQRHSRGLDIDQKIPLYHDESQLETETGRDPRTMDISEIHDEIQQIAEKFEDKKTELEKQRKQKQIEDSAVREQEQRQKWKEEYEADKQK